MNWYDNAIVSDESATWKIFFFSLAIIRCFARSIYIRGIWIIHHWLSPRKPMKKHARSNFCQKFNEFGFWKNLLYVKLFRNFLISRNWYFARIFLLTNVSCFDFADVIKTLSMRLSNRQKLPVERYSCDSPRFNQLVNVSRCHFVWSLFHRRDSTGSNSFHW